MVFFFVIALNEKISLAMLQNVTSLVEERKPQVVIRLVTKAQLNQRTSG